MHFNLYFPFIDLWYNLSIPQLVRWCYQHWPSLSPKLSSWYLQVLPIVSYTFTLLSEPLPLIFCLITTIKSSVLLRNQVNITQCWTKLHWNYSLSIWEYYKPLASQNIVLASRSNWFLPSISCLTYFTFEPWLLLSLAFLIAFPFTLSSF